MGFDFMFACLLWILNADKEKPGLATSGHLKLNSSLNDQSCDKLPGAE
jgi:hypothetical protein